jgi:flagellar hook-basal body complex protein FliE
MMVADGVIQAKLAVNHFEIPVNAEPDMFGLWLHEIQGNSLLWHQPDHHTQIADHLIGKTTPDDRRYVQFLCEVDFSCLRMAQIKCIIEIVKVDPIQAGFENWRTVLDTIAIMTAQIETVRQELIRAIENLGVRHAPSQGSLSPEIVDTLNQRLDGMAQLIDEATRTIDAQTKHVEEHAMEVVHSIEESNIELSRAQESIAALQVCMIAHDVEVQIDYQSIFVEHSMCMDILAVYDGVWRLNSAPVYRLDRLHEILVFPERRLCWSSDPQSRSSIAITITFPTDIFVVVHQYTLRSWPATGTRSSPYQISPYLKGWELYGDYRGEWQLLSKVECSTGLADGNELTTAISAPMEMACNAFRLCSLGRNRAGSSQMHLSQFTLMGDVISTPERLRGRPSVYWDVDSTHPEVGRAIHQPPTTVRAEPEFDVPNEPRAEAPLVVQTPETLNEVAHDEATTLPLSPEESVAVVAPPPVLQAQSPPVSAADLSLPSDPPTAAEEGTANLDVAVANPNVVVIDESFLFPLEPLRLELSDPPQGFLEVRQLSASRFGTTRLVSYTDSNGESKFLVAKYYNAGENRDGDFIGFIGRIITIDHPHVMPGYAVTAPTGAAGPILFTSYSVNGSLEDVLSRVRRHDPPPFWNSAGKLRIIVSMISGLNHLHTRGFVHRDLKPSDLIVMDDGNVRVCGYATSCLEEHRYARASQVGGPSYMAPEIYDDEHGGQLVRDPKTDVFSFGLILYEIISDGMKIFPSTMSAATIMRRAMSTRASDRPLIPDTVHPVLRELMSRAWVPMPSKRASLEILWKRMRGARFKLFPDVEVSFYPREVPRGP